MDCVFCTYRTWNGQQLHTGGVGSLGVVSAWVRVIPTLCGEFLSPGGYLHRTDASNEGVRTGRQLMQLILVFRPINIGQGQFVAPVARYRVLFVETDIWGTP